MSQSEKFWDKRAVSFDADARQDEETKLGSVQKSKKYLNDSDVVLDYGCASGIKSLALAGMVREVHGVDLSAEMIRLAQKNAAERSIKNVQFQQATVMDQRLKTGSFDAVLAFNVLHLVPDAGQDIERIHELLVSGGVFISETAALGQRSRWLGFVFRLLSKIGIVPDVTMYSFSELENLVAIRGFEILETADMGDMTYYIAARKS